MANLGFFSTKYSSYLSTPTTTGSKKWDEASSSKIPANLVAVPD